MNWQIKHYPNHRNEKIADDPHVTEDHTDATQCIVVGNIIFVSGCTADDTSNTKPTPSSVEVQVNLALDKARLAMETAGSAMENIVKTFFLITDLDHYQLVRKTETEYYEKYAPILVEKPPAASLMVVPSLADPELLVEYEVIGAVNRTAPDWPVTYYPEYWAGKELAYPQVPKGHAKFARTQVIGNLVLVSGCQALDHDTVKVETDDFREQSRIVLEKLKIGMEETGGSLNTMVKTIVFLKDLSQLQVYRQVEQEFYQEYAPGLIEHLPASTAMIVSELPRPEFLIEVEAIGISSTSDPAWKMKHYSGDRDSSSVVSAGKLLFLSACNGSNPENGIFETDAIAQQIIIALDKARFALEQAGSSMDGSIKTVVMLKHLEDYSEMRRTVREYFQKHAPHLLSHPPVSSFMQLPEIGNAKALFQIDITAVLTDNN